MGQCHNNQCSPSRNPLVTGRKKALLVGIDYRGTGQDLRGSAADAKNQRALLVEHFGFKESDILVLSEDRERENWPTKDRIMLAFNWLLLDARAGDLLFFHYSGHGSRLQAKNGDAWPQDCICPLDSVSGPWPESVILDVEVHGHLYGPVPTGCKAVAIFDCGHAAAVAKAGTHGQARGRYLAPPANLAPGGGRLPRGFRREVVAQRYEDQQIWVYSACQDEQACAEAKCDGSYQGVFTWAYIKALRAEVWKDTYIDLLDQVKTNLRGTGCSQIPALASSRASYLDFWYLGKQPLPTAAPENALSGRKRALLVGINYRGTPNELQGCINDVHKQQDILTRKYGFKAEEIHMMTEDMEKDQWPYKANMVKGFQWLLKDAAAGDLLFFHYSGHGAQVADATGLEPSGKSDCICPLDCGKAWPELLILDTDIHSYVYDRLPPKVRLICVFDCCHSGTVANLGRTRDMEPMAPEGYGKQRFHAGPEAAAAALVAGPRACLLPGLGCMAGPGDGLGGSGASGLRKGVASPAYEGKMLWVYSGCQDDQTSADAYQDGEYQGAFTWAFVKCLEESRFVERHVDLLAGIRRTLRGGYSQIPALSTTKRAYYGSYYMARRW